MFLKRTSPNNCTPLVGRSVEFGDTIPLTTGAILTACHTPDQAIDIGNMRTLPVFFTPPAHHKKRPSVIEQAKRSLENAYNRSKKILSKMFYVERQKRSERREAIVCVLQVILHYLDLDTLEVGFHDNRGTFIRLDVNYIAKQANITPQRVKRALRDIATAGYIETVKQYKRDEDGRYIGLPAIRRISPSLFIDLGIDHQQFFSSREYKRKREEKAASKRGKKMFRAIIGNALKKPKAIFKGVNNDKRIMKEKEIIANAIEMAQKTNMPVSEAYKILKRQNE